MQEKLDKTDRMLVRALQENARLTSGELAQRVNLSQSPSWRRIKHLEESVGAKLLLRTSQGATLTPPGQALVHHARVVLAQIEHLRKRADQQRLRKTGHTDDQAVAADEQREQHLVDDRLLPDDQFAELGFDAPAPLVHLVGEGDVFRRIHGHGLLCDVHVGDLSVRAHPEPAYLVIP